MKSRQILMFNAVSLVLGYLILIQITSSEVEACGPGRSGYRRGRLRRLVPLVQHQCVPNVGENSLGASGLPEGPIRKNQKRFRELVQNLNPDIVFRDDEGNGADRMMTQVSISLSLSISILLLFYVIYSIIRLLFVCSAIYLSISLCGGTWAKYQRPTNRVKAMNRTSARNTMTTRELKQNFFKIFHAQVS